MKIDCVADLHGYYPQLEGGDLLIIAGDLTASDTWKQYLEFAEWFSNAKYKKKIWISGNHDNLKFVQFKNKDLEYLCDSGTEFKGLKIWGSPWTQTFFGMNPNCKAFTFDTEEELFEKWKLIPNDVDILITHSPPEGILDTVPRRGRVSEQCGSYTLRDAVLNRIKPRLHVFGHIHEWGGQIVHKKTTKFINASHVDAAYQPVNKPVRITL